MNLIQATNTPVKIELAGTAYSVRTLNFRELASVSAWIEDHVPSPLARALQAIGQLKAAGKALDAATEELILDHATNAMLSWPPRVGSKPWFDALDGADGGLVELVYTILSKTVLGFDREKSQGLVDKLTSEEILDLVYLGIYGIRLKKDGSAETEEKEVSAENGLEESILEAAASGATIPPKPNWGVWRE